jgi:tetratricopeptide (TPR) repeat protein
MFTMRFALPLLFAIAACGHGGLGTLPTTPAKDLAIAKPTAPAPAPSATDPKNKDKDKATDKDDTRDPRITDLDVIRIRAVSRGVGGEPQMETVATGDLFKQANVAAKEGRYDEAIGLYRRIVAEFGDSGFAPVSLFNIAAIDDARGDPDATITTLRELIDSYPQSRESIDGHLYIAAVESEHKHFAEAVATLDQLLARANLTYADKLEAGARRGYGQLELGQLDAARESLTDALDTWKRAPHIDDPYYVAMASYYLGEVAHRQFTAAPVRLPDDQIIADLEAKRVFAASAYDRWRDTLDYKQPYWSSAAGYQMSQIFFELWEATVRAPYPDRIATEGRPKYIADLHARVREYLTKALDGHRMNVELAKAYGVDTSWSQGSDERAVQIMQVMAREDAGQLVTP